MTLDRADDGELAVTAGPDWVLLTLSGEVDVNAVPGWQELTAAALESRPTTVVVDLGSVTFMDSSGLGVLAALVRATREGGATIYALRPQDSVRRVIAVCGLDRYFVIIDRDDPRLLELRMLTRSADATCPDTRVPGS